MGMRLHELVYFTDNCIMHLVFIQISDYTKELEEMKNVTKQEFIASLRRFTHSLYAV